MMADGKQNLAGAPEDIDRLLHMPMWRKPVLRTPHADECISQLRLLSRRVAVVATSRSGSEWLSSSMRRLGIDCEEYLNPRSTVSRGKVIRPGQDPAEFIGALCKNTPGRIFATKGGIHTLATLFEIGEFPKHIAEWRFIHVRRRNVVGQAISLLLAEQTGQWRQDMERTAPVDVDALTFAAIASRIDQILEAQNVAARFFSIFSIKPFEIVYEDMVADPDRILGEVAKFLDLSPPAEVSSQRATRRQGTSLNFELEAGFRAELARIVLEGEAAEKKQGKLVLEHASLEAPFAHRGMNAWLAALPAEVIGLAVHARAGLTLYEDGRALGPTNVMEAEIRLRGGGRFALWPCDICFSSSDGTDPNSNGRHYELVASSFDAMAGAPLEPVPWLPPARSLGCAVVGLGARGVRIAEELSALEGVEVRWLVDNSPDRLTAIGEKRLPLSTAQLTSEFQKVLDDPIVDAIFIAVPDFLHKQFSLAAFGAGKNVFLEKPVATTLVDGLSIMRAWRHSGRTLQIGYVLRNAPFYREVKRVIREGLLGRIHSITLLDHLGLKHGASYMRRWHRDSRQSGGLMVHKGCHDLDIACWLFDARPVRLSSFGGVSSFTRSPPASRCTECPEQRVCHYRARPGIDPELCVFGAKDIVDNQTVSFELSGGIRGTFTLAMDNPDGSQRHVSILGTNGKLEGDFLKHRLTLTTAGGIRHTWSVEEEARGGHAGGDKRTIIAFLDACLGRRAPEVKTESDAICGLVFALAAEEARRHEKIVTIGDSLDALGTEN